MRVDAQLRPRAAALISWEQTVLLIRRVKAGREYYTLPGGSLEVGETPESACLREVREETGLVLKGLEPLSVLNIGVAASTTF